MKLGGQCEEYLPFRNENIFVVPPGVFHGWARDFSSNPRKSLQNLICSQMFCTLVYNVVFTGIGDWSNLEVNRVFPSTLLFASW